MATLPSALALTTIADGSLAVAADERNNFSAIQTDVNSLITFLTPSAGGQVLQSTSTSAATWVSGVKTTTSTFSGGPPGSPADGDIWIATGISGTTRWTFQFNSSGSTYKWECTGCTPVLVGPAGSVTTSSTSFVALTSGPAFSLSRAGEYRVNFGARAISAGTTNSDAQICVWNGSAPGTACIFTNGGLSGPSANVALAEFWSVPTPGTTLSIVVQTTPANSYQFTNGWLEIFPLRVT